jgi:hypothetical protein
MAEQAAASTLRELHESSFDNILLSEIEAINARRRALHRNPISNDIGTCERPKVTDAVGLALSGGGVRSAAFSLGVLQALNHNGVLDRIDYLSTVSGGGYIGTALSATMSRTRGEFVFGSSGGKGSTDGPLASEISDTRAVGHLRNYSNYLIPFGARDLITALAIVVRGLVANFGAVFPIVLLAATVTIVANPFRSNLTQPDFLGYQFNYLPSHFGLTVAIALLGFAFFLAWAIYRSIPRADNSEFRGGLAAVGAAVLVAIAIVFLCELQPFVINGMFELADAARQAEKGAWGVIAGAIQALAAIATPVAAAAMFFRQQLGDMLKADQATQTWSARSLVATSKLVVWIAGAALPLLIWVGYLYLSYWGIINDRPAPARDVGAPSITVVAEQAKPKQPLRLDLCGRQVDADGRLVGADGDLLDVTRSENVAGGHTPRWLLTTASCFGYWAGAPQWTLETESLSGRVINRPLTFLYFGVGVILFLLSLCLGPNANSLHRLYRDRLSKAFLFDPAHTKSATLIDQGRDFAPLDRVRITELSCEHAPYHLINAALNVQGSDYANRRGRNADFFIISPLHIGSLATGYASTRNYEAAHPDLDLATAMAISGAAASSNMGAKSIRPLTFTLTLLNIRLGYWLPNPRFAPAADGTRTAERPRPVPSFLLAELLGRLYEDGKRVYVTDGAHIENLGVYELLKRRCKLIVVVDAEADLAMRFPSFITLQRYARIDLGIRIEMPWDQVRKTTGSWIASEGGLQERAPSTGPHAAIGVIEYGGGEKGHLLYIKSSLTGDENDYILDYARRFRSFPHETTGDQFFSEEQFEVYRALGFHVAHGVICGRDVVELHAEGKPTRLSLKASGNATIDAVRAALKG